MLEDLRKDLKGGLRILAKSPGFTAVAVLSLGLGIGANTAIFTIINAVFLHPLPVAEPSQLVEVFTRDTRTVQAASNFILTGSSIPNFQDYRDQNSVFSGMAAATFPIPLNWGGQAEPEQLNAILVTANYFEVFGVKPILGRTFVPDEDKKPGGNALVVLSHALWARRFGSNRDVIGHTMILNTDPYTIIGVAPPNFKGTFALGNPELLWIPLSMRANALTGFAREYAETRRFRWLSIVGRLKQGVTLDGATAQMKTLASALEQEYPTDNRGRTVELAPLTQSALGINQRRQFELAGAVLMGAVGVVLLIACVNLANLLLAQAAGREKEMSIRAAMGANRWRLVAQLLTESVLLAWFGGVVGLALAFWGRTLLWSFRPPFLNADAIKLSLDGRVLAFTASISLITGILFGLFPALRASRTNLIDVLKVGGIGNATGWKENPLRSGLVVLEMALTVLALCGAGLFLRSMRNAQRLDLGFESRNLLMLGFDLSGQRYETERGQQFFKDALQRALSVPGVEAATVATNAPLAGFFAGTVFREGESPENPSQHGTLLNFDTVTPGYFEALRIPLRSGRDFTEFDRENTTSVVIVNEVAARLLWPGQAPLGKRFNYFRPNQPSQVFEVVGVVANSVVVNIGEDPQPVAYFPLRQRYSSAATLQVRTSGNPEAVMGTVRTAVQELDRNLALRNVQTIQQILDQGLWASRMGAALLGIFGLLALTLATIGVYGVMAYSVKQRTAEIGIRMALGARSSQVQRLVLLQGMKLALAGASIGVVISLLVAPLAEKLLYSVNARDPWIISAVTMALVCVAAVACYIPARRATRVDPILALRYE